MKLVKSSGRGARRPARGRRRRRDLAGHDRRPQHLHGHLPRARRLARAPALPRQLRERALHALRRDRDPLRRPAPGVADRRGRRHALRPAARDPHGPQRLRRPTRPSTSSRATRRPRTPSRCPGPTSSALQGAGAAIVTPLTLTLLSTAFPAEKRGLAIGAWSGISGLARRARSGDRRRRRRRHLLALDLLAQRSRRARAGAARLPPPGRVRTARPTSSTPGARARWARPARDRLRHRPRGRAGLDVRQRARRR